MPLFSGSGATWLHGLWEWLWAQWWLWVICNETKDSASWRPTNDDDTSDNEGATRLRWKDLMVCIWRCNRWLVWYHRTGVREVGPSIESVEKKGGPDEGGLDVDWRGVTTYNKAKWLMYWSKMWRLAFFVIFCFFVYMFENFLYFFILT